MQKNKNVVEDAILQIKNLEEALQENAKGILQSTMKEEIKQLVKESLKEQEDNDEVEVVSVDDTSDEDVLDVNVGDENDDDINLSDEEDDDDDDMLPMSLDIDDEDDDDEEDTIDLTASSDDEVLKVWQAMSPEDGIIVKKEDGMINLKDGEKEYMIQLGESMEDDFFDIDDLKFGSNEDDSEDYNFEDLEEEDDDYGFASGDDSDLVFEIVMDDKDDDSEGFELGEEMDLEIAASEDDTIPMEEEEDPYANTPVMDMEEAIMEAIKKSMKPKGMGMGNASKFKYDNKPNMNGGFNTKRKEAFGKGTKAMGTGKARFEYKEGEHKEGWDKVTMGGNKGDKSKTHKGRDFETKMETKEASRTNSYPNANKVGNRKGSDQNINRKEIRQRPNTRVNEEVEVLRQKNEEYRSALDVFRNKLNEVAVFNSNLAYATRLFTEHSTTKQEKINILRRFDSVETLKESKNLYKTIKDELGSTTSGSENTIKESFERTVVKTPSTGSATNLIESKTYENPQFMRMKDLMSKIK